MKFRRIDGTSFLYLLFCSCVFFFNFAAFRRGKRYCLSVIFPFISFSSSARGSGYLIMIRSAGVEMEGREGGR